MLSIYATSQIWQVKNVKWEEKENIVSALELATDERARATVKRIHSWETIKAIKSS